MKSISALVLFSGGLDSILACKLLEKQGIKVTAISFSSYFFDTQKAEEMAKKNSINLMVRAISPEHLEIVRKPKHGYGAAMNPCIDCHALMIKESLRVAQEEGYDIVATGEVLGQRPLSQNRRALEIIEKELQAEGKILRPLSVQQLPPTQYEKEGLVDSNQLKGIKGRGRKEQLSLAAKLGVKDYPTPGGGCRLTEKEFGAKLKELLEKVAKPSANDFELLRIGRHFYLAADNRRWVHTILGRNHDDNVKIETLAEEGDVIVQRKDKKGPTALVREHYDNDKKLLQEVKQLIFRYSKHNSASYDLLQYITKKV